ncbi:hypothetical protein AVEN_138622-1 [Araneus ventricosus]|uniref:Uncharacterized protein n=1 Tax=Araneus ventricosus TaxID=182803 RepID=A0A4Y2HN26_ARAVE|nr:hypothetical protein AVEN_138622-1 [Araneus ventricosus]
MQQPDPSPIKRAKQVHPNLQMKTDKWKSPKRKRLHVAAWSDVKPFPIQKTPARQERKVTHKPQQRRTRTENRREGHRSDRGINRSKSIDKRTKRSENPDTRISNAARSSAAL